MDEQETLLVVVDMQGKLAGLVHEHEALLLNVERMILIAQVLGIPILWTEQAPDKIGATIEPVARLLFPVVKPIAKRAFSCFGAPEFRRRLEEARRPHVLICGIESHVCVYQTARDLHRHGYNVDVVADAVSARGKRNNDLAMVRMRQQGVGMTSVEMAACDLMQSADHPKFREVMSHIKR